MAKPSRFLPLLILIILLAGCRDQRILERLGFTQTSSYDLLPNGKLEISFSIPKADTETKAMREVLTTTSDSVKEARIKLSRQTSLTLVSGQLRNALFGLSLAKSGLGDHVDTLIRDPSISPRVKITVVNGEAGNILQKDYKQHARTGKYIDRLLEKEAKGQTIPKVMLLDFTRDYYDDGIDPVTPIIRDAGDSVTTDGIALFQDDKYITKIPAEDALIFAFLRSSLKQGEVTVNLKGRGKKKEIAMLSALNSKLHVSVTRGNLGKTKVIFQVHLKGSILEYIGDLKLSDVEDRKQLEKQLSDYFSNTADDMVLFMQNNQVDSLGVGKYVRNSMSYAQWKKLNWREEFPEVEAACHIHVTIQNFGKFR